MKLFRSITPLVATAALAVVLGLSACGDDESSDASEDATSPNGDVSVGTTGTTTDPTEAGPTGKLDGKKAEKPKITGPTQTIPEVGVVPKPTKQQRQQIAECVEKAGGDPQKLAKCGQIVVK